MEAGRRSGRLGSITVSALGESFDAALAIMADDPAASTFPADEFEWRTRQRSVLEQARTSPAALSSQQLMKVLYPNDARQITRITLDSLNKMKREDLIEHYKVLRPSGNLAGIVGDIAAKDAVAKLEKALGAWKGGPIAPVTFTPVAPIAEKKVYLINRPGSVQTDITLANRAIDRKSPDYIACMVMNQVLGSGPAARLFRIIREEKGYTYGVSSSYSATNVSQHFSSSMSVRTEVTEAALADLLKEFHEIREVTVPKDELDGAKRTLVANFALGLENPSGVLTRWMQQREYGLPEDYWDAYSEKVMAVTAADIAAWRSTCLTTTCRSSPSATARNPRVTEEVRDGVGIGRRGELSLTNDPVHMSMRKMYPRGLPDGRRQPQCRRRCNKSFPGTCRAVRVGSSFENWTMSSTRPVCMSSFWIAGRSRTGTRWHRRRSPGRVRERGARESGAGCGNCPWDRAPLAR